MLAQTYNIIGTGAIGGYCGACLQKAGIPVNFLLRADYEHVKNHGLIVESVNGDFTLAKVNAYQSVAEMPPADVIIIALKSTNNHLLPKLLPPLMKENTVVLLLQNGLGCEAEVAKIIGAERVMGGVVWIAANKLSSGHINHVYSNMIVIGQYSPNYNAVEITEKMQQVKTDFETAGIEIKLTENLLQARWQKSYFHIPSQALSVILDSTPKKFMAYSHTQSLVEAIRQEIHETASAYGCVIEQNSLMKQSERKKSIKPFIGTMKLDYQNKKPLEIEAILGIPLREAMKAGVKVPLMKMLYQQLKFLDAHNRNII